ncbi:MAG: hypothetical protein EOO60_03485 [Hymenobacter sp.]|nr:MAG: hypothetical protein EOO60_03485 [Hymenobacter sp.]
MKLIKKDFLFDKLDMPSQLLGIALFKQVFGLPFLIKGLACKIALLEQEPPLQKATIKAEALEIMKSHHDTHVTGCG